MMKQPNSADKCRKNSGKSQVKSALAFFCIAGALILAVSFFLSPLAPTLAFSIGARAKLREIDVTDNGVSEYSGLSSLLNAGDDFAVSVLPDIPAGYSLVKDYLMFLNREKNVTKILLNISSEAADLLNAGLTGKLDDRFYELTAGMFCASVEFRDFVSLVRSLNLHLLPDRRIGFAGIADNPAEDYAEAAEKYGTLLLLSRDEAHGEGGVGGELPDSVGIADVYYVSASTSYDEKVTDLLLPLTAKGFYYVTESGLDGLRRYYAFTMNFNKKQIGINDGMLASGSPFFFVTAGGIADAAEEEEQTGEAEEEEMDYGF